MQAVCPITDTRINERVARLNALTTIVLALGFITLNFWGGLIFLVVDFGIRGFGNNKFSIICQFNIWLVKKLNLSPKIINAGPKIFAAQVGFVISLSAFLAYVFQLNNISLALIGILALFSFLELAFGFCVACQLYPIIRRKP